ncbi:hypothetical protein CN424_28045 [Bacillus cereus]|nr:hypothetical protein CN424_28045 [Bacillus cereus]
MLNIYSNITFPKVNYRIFSQKRHSCSVFFYIILIYSHLIFVKLIYVIMHFFRLHIMIYFPSELIHNFFILEN